MGINIATTPARTDPHLGDLRQWLARNPHFDPDGSDLHASAVADGFDWDGLDRAALIPLLRGYQRLHRLHQPPEQIHELLGLGYRSAVEIAQVPHWRFVQRHGETLGGPAAADLLHRRACRIRMRALHAWATVRGSVASRWTRALRFNNVSAATMK